MLKPDQARSSAGPVDRERAVSAGTWHSVRRYAAFRLLLLGTLATNSAFWMYQVSLGWIALEMTDSPQFVGLAGFASGIPLLLFALPAGIVIDHFDRRIVLRTAQFGIMVVSSLFAVLVGTGTIERWSLLVLAACYGTVMSFIFPVRTTIVPSLVDRADLPNAVALNAAVQNATRVLGPSLAGVLIAVIGVSGTFAVAAAMQILALFSTSRLPASASGRSGRAGGGSVSPTVGLRIVASSPWLTALILTALVPTVLVMPYINLMPVFARDELGIGSTGLGLLLASTGLGTVVGALIVAGTPRLAQSSGRQSIAAVGFAGFVAAFALIPAVIPAMLVLFVAGLMSASFQAMNQTALQLGVADETRGRVLSVYLLTWGMLPIGQLTVGTMADHLGAPTATFIACCVAVGILAIIAVRFPTARNRPTTT